MAGAGSVRGPLLRTWRYGESHQGTVQLVCRPGERGNDACESDAVVSIGDGLYLDQRSAPVGSKSDGVGAGAGFHHSHQVAEDRRANSGDSAQSLGVDGIELSLARSLSAGVEEPALLATAGKTVQVRL